MAYVRSFFTVFFFFFFKSSRVYNSNNVIQISNYCNWPWRCIALAFTIVCLISEDGQLSHNAHFIEIIVLIMALRIHHCQHCRVTYVNTTFRHSEMYEEHLASPLTFEFFLSPKLQTMILKYITSYHLNVVHPDEKSHREIKFGVLLYLWINLLSGRARSGLVPVSRWF